jgi:hypothetical protein
MSIKIDTLAQDSLLQDLNTTDTSAVVGGGGYAPAPARRGGGFSVRFAPAPRPAAPVAPAAPIVIGYVPGTFTNVTGNTVVSGGFSSGGGSATGIATGVNASSSATFVAGAGFGTAAVGGSANAATGTACNIPAYLGD